MLRLPRRLARDESAVAVVEFALIFPMMLTVYVAGYIITDMANCQRKANASARALAEAVSAQVSPSGIVATPSTSLAAYFTGARIVMYPYSTGTSNKGVTESITLYRVCDATKADLMWTASTTYTGTSTTTSSQSQAITTSNQTLPSGISGTLINSAMVPTSPDGTDVCSNTPASNTTTGAVMDGAAGSFLYSSQMSYTYTPPLKVFIGGFFSTGYTLTTPVEYMVARQT